MEFQKLEKQLRQEIKTREKLEKQLEKMTVRYNILKETSGFDSKMSGSGSVAAPHLQAQDTIEHEIIFDRVNDIIYTVSFKGIITYVNATGIRLAPIPKEQIVGLHFSVFVRQDYQRIVNEVFNQILQHGVTDSYFEFPLQFPSGLIIWLGQNTSLLEGKKGEPYMLLIAKDITRQKEVELERNRIRKQLESSEIKYRSILENMKLGLLEVDNSGMITRAYPSFCAMVDYSEGELIGESPEDFLLIEQSRKFLGKSDNRDRRSSGGLSEVQIRTRGGKEIWVLVSESPYFDLDGNTVGYISIYYDITSIKDLQRELISSREIAEKAQMAQKQFLATMSHEIKTPLNAIIGMSHLLADSRLDTEQADSLEIIISSTNILRSLISDILDISKIDSGNVEAQSEPIDLSKMFQALNKIFKIKLGKKKVDLTFELDPNLNCQILGDELLLNQVFMNLLSNAVKFTHSGSINVTGAIIAEYEKTISIRFAVRDSGIGISEEQIPIIFDQFRQAHRKIQDEYGGTGLGLAITKKVIELMGGQIQVQSAPSRGSEFWFELQFGKTAMPLNVTEPTMKTLAQEFHFPFPILIVEDNAMNQKYFGKLLDKWKIQYHIANNGREGVELANKNKYCLILMDLQMPVMDGFKATRQLRNSENPLLHNIPIVALTASTLLNKREEVIEAGMNEYLAKPFTPEQLAAVFNKCCQLYGEEYMALLNSADSFAFSNQLDSEYLFALYRDDLEYAQEMFDIFLENVPLEISKLIDAIKENRYDLVSQIAHKIKPTFPMVGLSDEGRIMEKIEDAGNDHIVDSSVYTVMLSNMIYHRIPLVEAELNRIRTFIKSKPALVQTFN